MQPQSGMMQVLHIAATAAGTPLAENDPWTAIGLGLLICLGLATAAIGAMVLNRSLTRGWVRFHRDRRILSDDGSWTTEEVTKGLASE